MSTVTIRARLGPLLALAALLLVLVPGTPAWAHNALAEASPAKGATLKESPAEVRLRFLQKLDPDHTTITVSDAGGAKVTTSAPTVKGAIGSVTIGQPLANGVYTVAYQVVSTDGHPVKGSYEFTVDDPAPPAESPSPSPSAAAPAPAATTTSATSPPLLAAEESSNTTVYGLVAGIAVAVAAVAAFLFIRRRKA
ncbi:copper resistance CopC family protein [Actinoplanes flavus]|uniref:Copper resistance protein CopC n=1 Tax=Actinoplanes flavus TaxID=2820290 RepID=A0ABS3UFD0_9ACTN|nr:copper resistance CopC family protein [Actinoplanes flavus]MBO3736951.1 copper resistance protein CopC [Actinoplanes flavus]